MHQTQLDPAVSCTAIILHCEYYDGSMVNMTIGHLNKNIVLYYAKWQQRQRTHNQYKQDKTHCKL